MPLPITVSICFSLPRRVAVLNMLSSNPPFSRKTESVLNTLALVERLWAMMWSVAKLCVFVHVCQSSSCSFLLELFYTTFDGRVKMQSNGVYDTSV